MSRWLKSVNNLLDKLDDQVEIADAAAFTQRMARHMTGRGDGGGGETSSNEGDGSFSSSDVEEEEDYEEIPPSELKSFPSLFAPLRIFSI